MTPNSRNTSLPLIILTLLTGIALGWWLNDLTRRPPPAAVPQAPTALPPPTPGATLPPATATIPLATATLPPPTVAPSNTPAPTVTPSPPPTSTPLPAVIGYAGHRVAAGETLEQIAARYTSTAAQIAAYNLLEGPPRAGRELVIPLLAPLTVSDAAPLVIRGAAERPWVALTLDAGADAAPTPRMLEALRARGVTITFFLTGRWIRDNPDLVRQIVADGHEIANHTYSHPDLTTLEDDAIRSELADTEAILRETAPGASIRPFFRPPYGAYDERVLRVIIDEGYLPVYWTLDSLDSVGEPKTAAFLLERVTARLTPDELRGAIILAHCGSAATADALPQILDRLSAMGFEVRKLSDVMN